MGKKDSLIVRTGQAWKNTVSTGVFLSALAVGIWQHSLEPPMTSGWSAILHLGLAVAVLGASFFQFFGIRCPRCHAPWTWLAARRGNLMSAATESQGPKCPECSYDGNRLKMHEPFTRKP